MRIVFDLDDTICRTENRDYVNSSEISAVVSKIRELRDTIPGVEIVVHTSRGMASCNGDAEAAEKKNRPTIEAWLREHGIKVDEIIFGKPLADLYVDDKAIERGVPSPKQRLEAIRRIAEADAGGATLRLRPFIIGVTTPTYLDLIRAAHSCGASAMSTEFFCVEQRSPTLRAFLPTLNALAGFDIMAFYRKYSAQSGYLRLNRKVKEPFMRKMKELCEELGMRFYVSDAHFKELSCNGSCCGLPPTWNYSRGQWCEALQIAKNRPDHRVGWADVRNDIEQLVSGFTWARASGFNCNSSERRAKYEGMTMADYMKWLWNNPQSGQSPYKLFEGALTPVDKDSEGNLIYEYNGATF